MAKFTSIFVLLTLAVIANCHPTRTDVDDSTVNNVDTRHNSPVVDKYPLPPLVVPVKPYMERSQRHCGPLNGNKLCEDGLCCSIYGKCGSTDAHCVTKCDYRFGVCRDGSKTNIVSKLTALKESSKSNESPALENSSDSNDTSDSTDTSESNDSSEEIEKTESDSTSKEVSPDLYVEDASDNDSALHENTTPIKKNKVSAVEKKLKLAVPTKFTESEVKPAITHSSAIKASSSCPESTTAKTSTFCFDVLPSTHTIKGTFTSDGDKTTLSDVAMTPISI